MLAASWAVTPSLEVKVESLGAGSVKSERLASSRALASAAGGNSETSCFCIKCAM